MSVTKFAFLPSNAAGATLHTYFPLTLCYIHSLSGVYPSNTLPLVVRYQKEGHRATQTARLSDWAMMSAGDCLWERSQDRNTLVPHHRLLTSSPHLIEAPRLLMGEEGHSSWGVSLLRSCVHQLRIKPPFLFQTLSPYFFILLRWAEKVKILASNTRRCPFWRPLFHIHKSMKDSIKEESSF